MRELLLFFVTRKSYVVSNRLVERYSKFGLSYIWDLSRLVVVNTIFIHLCRYLDLKKISRLFSPYYGSIEGNSFKMFTLHLEKLC